MNNFVDYTMPSLERDRRRPNARARLTKTHRGQPHYPALAGHLLPIYNRQRLKMRQSLPEQVVPGFIGFPVFVAWSFDQ